MIEKDCAEYLKKKNLHLFLTGVRKKYESYGRFTGRIRVQQEECSDLSGILGYGVAPGAQIRVDSFVEALQGTKYGSVDMKLLLEAYFDETVVTKEQQKMIDQNIQDHFHSTILTTGKQLGVDAKLMNWLKDMIENRSGGYRILNLYRNTEEDILLPVLYGLQLVHDQMLHEPLAVAASHISGNPHFLDRESDGGKLFIYGLSYLYDVPYPKGTLQLEQLCASAGITKDEIAGSVVMYGVGLYRCDGIHQGAQACYGYGEPFVCTKTALSNLISVGDDGQIILIVENEMVFTWLLNHIKDQHHIGLICTSGQLSTVAWNVLSLMKQTDCRLYYSGDMDPEGLLIGQSVLRQMNGKVTLWHMSEQDYIRAMSKEPVSERRMALLANVKDSQLISTGNMIRKYGFSAYQENILDLYLNDIENTFQ